MVSEKSRKPMRFLLKYSIFFLFFLNGIVECKAQSQKLDEKNGFRDLTFGQEVTKIQELTLLRTIGNHTWYTRTTDKLAVGEALLTSIWYRFYKNKLYAIEIIAPLLSNRPLLKQLQAAYGGDHDYTMYNLDSWEIDSNKVNLMYREDKASQNTKVEIWSVIIGAQMDIDNKNEARKKAQADL